MPSDYKRHEPEVGDMAWRRDEDRLLLTNRRMALYARSFYIWWGHSGAPVYALDPYLIYHTPTVSWAQVVSDRFPKDMPKEEKYDKAKAFVTEEFPAQFAEAFREEGSLQGGKQGEAEGQGVS